MESLFSSILLLQKNSCLFLQNMVEDILDFSKLEFKSFQPESSWFSMSEIVQEVFDIMKIQIGSKRVKLLTENISFVPMEILTDQKRIKRVILNLVCNALKFTFDGSITVSWKIKQEASEASKFLIVSVKDTGIGISEENQK